MKEEQNQQKHNIEQRRDNAPSFVPPKLLWEQNFELVKRLEKLIADWYQFAVQSSAKAIQMHKSLSEPASATSSGSFSGGQPSSEVELELEPERYTPPARLPSPPENKPWRWSLVWLGILGAFGGLGTAALVWLTALPPLPNCQQVSQLTVDGERLYCAQQAAQTGELPKIVASLEMLKQWDQEHPLYTEASRLIDDWSAQILANARIKMQENDAKGAIEAIKHIPKTSPAYAEGQEIVKEWRQQWQKGKDVYGKAQTAMKQQNWDEVSEQILVLSKFDHTYWSTIQTNVLSQQLGVERQARQLLIKAQAFSKNNSYRGVKEAVSLAQKVPPKTYAGADAKVSLTQWSKLLLTAGFRQWDSGDRRGAILTLLLAPASNTAPEVQDLVRFGNAYSLVNSSESLWVPTGEQIWNLMEAIAAIKQVKSTSPFYPQAQAYLKAWQTSLKDAVQVKYATLAAGMGQHSTLKLAIAQAKQVPLGHVRRVQAQTLIAYWAEEVERIEDEPFMVRAKDLAKSGTIPDLKLAIAQARNIQLGRALRGQAQDWISTWRGQIEVIEDQPILAQAQAFGRQGKLNEAIDAASRIKAKRALYPEAQTAILGWRAEQIRIIQITQDQPILNQARAMALRGNLQGAIDIASQISPGRALYYEAQGSVGRWQEELRPPVYIPPESTQNQTPGYTPPEGEWDDIDPTANGADDPFSPLTLESSLEESYVPPEESISDDSSVIDAMPIDEIVPSYDLNAPSSVYEPPQPAEPDPQAEASDSDVTGYYDQRYYNKP
ncbi:MAG: hypothetical protein KME11_19500 [Timaviella obliquedivisa GSE-PSE-MK23-08B]|jgi:hypothetical protein|nr:hypothetical protein [Timaviella obliquedivisa GSE-PSE-MK23-08B]